MRWVVSAVVAGTVLVSGAAWAAPPDFDAVDACDATVVMRQDIELLEENPNPVDYVDATDLFLASETKGAKKIGKLFDKATIDAQKIRAVRKAYKFCEKIGEVGEVEP